MPSVAAVSLVSKYCKIENDATSLKIHFMTHLLAHDTTLERRSLIKILITSCQIISQMITTMQMPLLTYSRFGSWLQREDSLLCILLPTQVGSLISIRNNQYIEY